MKIFVVRNSEFDFELLLKNCYLFETRADMKPTAEHFDCFSFALHLLLKQKISYERISLGIIESKVSNRSLVKTPKFRPINFNST